VASLRFAVNLSILFTELPLLERPAAATRAGFDAAEFWWPWPVAVPSDPEIDRFAVAITDAGVQLVGLNFFAGDMPGGDRGLVSWPARSAEFRDNIDVTIGLGERCGKLDLDGFLDRIAATGYDGWVGLEYKPSGASADSFDSLPRERRSSR
jgi:hydroxypyruvate isomerase